MRLEDVGPQRNLPDSAEPWGRYTDQKIRELQRQVQRLTGETKGVRQVVAAAADSADALVTDAKDTADQAKETGDTAIEEAANAAQEAVNAKEAADLAIEDAAAAFREANAARQAAAEAWKQAANQTPNWSFEEGAVRWASNFGFNDTNISEVTGAPDGRYVARVTLGNSVRHELRTANDDAHRVEPERIWDVVVRARVTSGSATIGVGAYVFNKSDSGFAFLVPTTESRTTAGGWVTLRARIETNDVTHEFIAPMVTAQNVVGNTVEFDAIEFKDVTDAVLAQTIADAAAFQAAQALSKANDAQDAAEDAQETADAAMVVATDAQKDATDALDRAKSRMRAGQNVITNGDFEDSWLGWNPFGDYRFTEVIEDPNARSRSKVMALRPSGKIVAENLIPDPRGKTVSLWRVPGTVGITSEGITALENAGGGSLYIDSTKNFYDFEVGDVFTFRAEVKVNSAMTMLLRFGAYSGAAGNQGWSNPILQVPDDGWVTHEREMVITEAAAGSYIRALVWPMETGLPEGVGFTIRNVSLQKNSNEPFFSGASSNSGEISYEWTGTPDESTSLKRDGTARNVYPATDWYPTSGGREYTIEAWVKLVDPAKSNGQFQFYCVTRDANEAWTGAWTSNDTSIPAGSLTQGEWTKFTSTFITPANAVSINFAPHVMSGTGEVYVDDVLIIDTTESTAARIVGEEALLGVNDAVADLTELFTTEITRTSDQILSTVSNEYVATTDMIEEIGLIQSQIDQQAENIDFRFIEVSESVIDLEGELQGYQSELATYIRFNNEGIELGKVGNPFITRLSNTELAFYESGQKVAHISNNQLNITNATINNNLAMGTGGNGYFDWIPRENGNLSFKFRED